MRKVAAVALGAFLLAAGVFVVCAQRLDRGRAEAAALASAGAAMAIGGTIGAARRRALPSGPPSPAFAPPEAIAPARPLAGLESGLGRSRARRARRT